MIYFDTKEAMASRFTDCVEHAIEAANGFCSGIEGHKECHNETVDYLCDKAQQAKVGLGVINTGKEVLKREVTQAPTVAFDPTGLDVDPARAGVQVQEATTLHLNPTVTDDVQARAIDLLINGNPALTDVSYPWDLSFVVPTLEPASSVTLQVRATDTGGNAGLSAPVTLEVVPDLVPPTVLDINPPDGSNRGQAFHTLTIHFSEPLAPGALTTSNFQLTSPNGPVVPTAFQFTGDDRFVQLTYPDLDVGPYQLVISGTGVTDRAGNALGADFVSHFTIVTASAVWANPAGGFWDVASNWENGKVPGPTDDVLIDLPAGAAVIYRGIQPAVSTLTNRGTLWVQGNNAFGHARLTVTDRLLNAGTIRVESSNNTWSSTLTTPAGQLVNLETGVIVVNRGSNGASAINGNLVNKGRVMVASDTLLTISGVYEATGGSIDGPGYLENAQVKVTASPASPTTILLSGTSNVLVTDNLPNMILWVQGNSIYGDALLTTTAGVANRGTIRLESIHTNWRSNLTAAAGGLLNGTGGVISVGLGTGGERKLTGDLVNAGMLLFAGASPVAFTVTGNYTQTAVATLNVRLAGRAAGQYDQLRITGRATLDGSLAVSLLGGFVPRAGDVLAVVTHGSRVGTFANLLLPQGVTLQVVYSDSDTRLTS